jgi:hypothetical protein
VAALAVSTLLIGSAQRRTVAALQGEEQARRERALAQVNGLADAAPGAVPGILDELQRSGDEVLPRLRERYAVGRIRGKRMRLALALLRVEPEAVREELMAWMLEAEDPNEVLLVRDGLKAPAAPLTERLWRAAGDARAPPGERFRALVVLASFDPESPRWGMANEVLLNSNPLHLGVWVQALRPGRQKVLGPLGRVFRSRLAEQKQVAALVLADYAVDQPELLADLLLDADPKQYAVLLPMLRRHGEQATALLRRQLARTPTRDWKDPR